MIILGFRFVGCIFMIILGYLLLFKRIKESTLVISFQSEYGVAVSCKYRLSFGKYNHIYNSNKYLTWRNDWTKASLEGTIYCHLNQPNVTFGTYSTRTT